MARHALRVTPGINGQTAKSLLGELSPAIAPGAVRINIPRQRSDQHENAGVARQSDRCRVPSIPRNTPARRPLPAHSLVNEASRNTTAAEKDPPLAFNQPWPSPGAVSTFWEEKRCD